MNIAEDFYLVRTPILPVEFPEQLNNTSFNELPDAIKNIFQDDLLQEAIYIASPELYQEFRKWQEGRLTGEKDVQKLTSALFRYLLRMSSRCTPYGLFAGCATGHPGDVTSITLHDKTQHKKHSRLDMNYVAELASMITSIPEIQEQLRYYPNNSLYRTGSTYRYAAFTIKNKFRNYYLTSVNASEYLEKIFQVAENGATLTDIRSAVISEDVTGEEAEEFISELISSQLLVSGLEPTVTGDEFFQLLIRKLEMLQHTNEYTNVLQRINGLLKEQQTGTSKYVGIHSLVKSLLTDTTNKDLIQTDLFLSTTSNTLGSKVISDITRQVNQLWKLARANNNGDLRQFCNSFRQRYEEQEIPLTLALDTESGIGYAGHSGSHTDHTPLVDDLVTPPSDRNETMNRSKMLEFQLQQLHACLRENKQEIVLTDEHLGQLKETDTPRLPYSMYLMGSILAGSAAAIDAGEYLFEMNGCSGPSAANLLGRFCHGDEQLTAHVNACLRAEEQHDPECIYAEIIHLPESRTGNILMRPRLRSYEIVYLANSDAPAEYQIPVSDLMVSVQRDKVVLRSRRLNKRVIPRLSTAHNFRHGLPLYKFLCDLQTQDLHAGLAWGWQIPGNERFLPRVRYGNIILSKAQWILNKKDYPGLKKDNTTAYAETCREMRKQLQLPRHIVIAEGDNELLIDFENESSLHLLATTLIKKEQLVLQEFLGTPDNCWIESAGGKHTNEFIIPLRNADKANEAAFQRSTTIKPAVMPVRHFAPGSEWLYVKIYCGTRTAESMLKDVLRPLTTTLIEEGMIDKWFFIRYSDPEHHIRIRFHHANNEGFWKDVLEALYGAMQEYAGNSSSYRIQLDTYDREIERYGAATMELGEDLFYYDSECVIHFLDLLSDEEGEQYRWLLAVRGTDMLLDAFGYTLPTKSALLKQLQAGFFREFGGEKPLLLQLNDKYRNESKQIASFLDPTMDEENGISEAIAFFTTRSEKIQDAIRDHTAFKAANSDELLSSYIHMFLNRILLSNQRKHELVIYHFLNRYYESALAIQKKKAKTAVQ